MIFFKGINEIIPIEKNVTTIGRHTKNDIVVNSLRVSRFHSEIVLRDNKIFLKDNSTINGSYIQKHRVLPDREIQLKIGDTIGIGCKANEEAICSFEIIQKNSEVVNGNSSINENSSKDHSVLRNSNCLESTSSCDCEILPSKSVKNKGENTLSIELKKPTNSQMKISGISGIRKLSGPSKSRTVINTKACSPPPLGTSNNITANADNVNSELELKISSCKSSKNNAEVPGHSNDALISRDKNYGITVNKPARVDKSLQCNFSTDSSNINHTVNVITISDCEQNNSISSLNVDNKVQNSSDELLKEVQNLEELNSSPKGIKNVHVNNVSHNSFSNEIDYSKLPPDLINNKALTIIPITSASKNQSHCKQDVTVSCLPSTSVNRSVPHDKLPKQKITIEKPNSTVSGISIDLNKLGPSKQLKQNLTNVNLIKSNLKQTTENIHELQKLHHLNEHIGKVKPKDLLDVITISDTDFVSLTSTNKAVNESTKSCTIDHSIENLAKKELEQSVVSKYQHPDSADDEHNQQILPAKMDSMNRNYVSNGSDSKPENNSDQSDISSKSLFISQTDEFEISCPYIQQSKSASNAKLKNDNNVTPKDIGNQNSTKSDVIPCIDLSVLEDEQDIKPKINLNYSNVDEIITLNSDDEDFPSSQLNTTNLRDVPDFASTFEIMFDDSNVVIKEEEPELLHCNENTWFDESLTRNNLIDGKYALNTNFPVRAEMRVEGENILNVNKDEQSKVNDVFEIVQTDENEINDEMIQKYAIKKCYVRLSPVDKPEEYNFKLHKRKSVDIVTKDEKNKDLNIDKVLEKSYEKSVKKTEVIIKKGISKPQIKNDDFKIKQGKKNQAQTISQIQRKKMIQLKRKEKLKEIGRKVVNEKTDDLKVSSTFDRKPVVKNTSRNRTSCFVESLVEDYPIKKKKKIDQKDNTSLKNVPSSSKQCCVPSRDTQRTDEKNKINKFQFESPTSAVEKLLKNYISEPTSKQIPIIFPNSVNQETACNLESKIIRRSENKTEPRKMSNNITKSDRNNENQMNNFSNFLKEQEEIDRKNFLVKKSTEMYPKRLEKEKTNYKKEVPVLKSNLKVRSTVFEYSVVKNKSKKKVKIPDGHDEKLITIDPDERRNNDIFAPAFKLSENLIKECSQEFETAIAKVCSWSVSWLEEQQKIPELPPLYPEYKENEKLDFVIKYKEQLKSSMFQNLWKAMFTYWNKPNNDFLPHTQLMPDKNNLCCLHIDKVDTFRSEKQLWTIHASRILNVYENGNDISSGQIVIVNFHVQREADEIPIKTMAFAYIVSANKISLSGESSIQTIVLKIYARSFRIMPGEIKLKALNYLRTFLRPFQALAVVSRSPLAKLILDCQVKVCFKSTVKYGDDTFTDKFLDSYQKKAIVNCLNCICNSSTAPSLYLVDGSPGTGKTQVIVSLIHEIFSTNEQNLPDNLKILIIATSDNTADDLSYRLETFNKKKKCMNLLRYGNCRGMHSIMKDCTLDKKVQDLIENDSENLINSEEEINNLRAKVHSIKLVLDSKSAKPEKLAEARSKLIAAEKDLNDMVSENSTVMEQLRSYAAKKISIENSDIIVTSMSTCWSSEFENDFFPTDHNKGDVHKFTICIFDDANRINETGMLIPMMLMVRTLILVGDYRNHISVSAENSPYYRLITEFCKKSPIAVTSLNAQYRIHPDIMRWFKEYFHLTCQYKSMINPKPNITPFLVINLILSNESDMILRYEEQADACVSLLEQVDQHYTGKGKFAVIAAHERQRDMIKQSMFYGSLNKDRKILVDTLEEFSGRERDMIILFLPYTCQNYDKWLYVAITRAKDSLVICGDISHIEQKESISSLIQYSKSKNIYVSWNPCSEKKFPINLLVNESKNVS